MLSVVLVMFVDFHVFGCLSLVDVKLIVVLVMFVDFHAFGCLSLVDVNLAKPSYLESLPKKGLE